MEVLSNYINNSWVKSKEAGSSDVINPATQEVLAKVPLGKGTAADVAKAVEAAAEAYKSWSQAPVMKRVQPLYKLKQLLEENAEDIARTITTECGKTIAESRGELQRAIENVETACGTPMLIQSEFSENIASGVDERPTLNSQWQSVHHKTAGANERFNRRKFCPRMLQGLNGLFSTSLFL